MANKIAILGSSGTIGKILAHELAELKPFSVTRRDCDLSNRLATENFLKEYRFDTIINCAAVGGKQTLGQFIADDLYTNLKMFQNLRALHGCYGVLINIGTGAEFDISQNISQAKETMLDERLPKDSYGLAKNLISRQCKDMPNALTLRVFGCFHPNEPDFRLLKQFNQVADIFTLKNRKFSWISAIDFADIIKHVIQDWKNYPLDINCAYNNEIDLNEFLSLYSTLHGLNKKIEIVQNAGLDYTCNSDFLYSCHQMKYGLENSLRAYR